MSITVKPDPDHPLGGHALLVVNARVPQGPVSVSVTDLFEDRHLGPKGWQQAPVALGPYAAQDEGGTLVVPVGPEIVDQIPEFAALRITVAGVSTELSWPDSVRMSPSHMAGGGIDDLARKQAEKPKARAPKTEEPKTETVAEPQKPPIIEGEEKVDPPKPPNRLPMILAALLLLAALAAGAWWYLGREPAPAPAPEPAPVPAPDPAPQPPSPPVISPAPVAAGCDPAGLTAAAAKPPAEAFAAVAACGAQGDPETRFRIIERAADAGVAEALAMIGRWYDPAEAAAVGSSFTRRDPAQAARYYRDAADRGHAPAAALLARACAALRPDQDPTHEIAREQYCPRN
jgi:outer membrane biosynthesis protein TonB